MTLTLASLLLSSLALCGSICALVVARRSSGRSLLRQLSALSIRLGELEEMQLNMAAAMKRENVRVKMAALRERRKATENGAGDEPLADPEAAKDRWTRETNLKIARGEIRPFWRS